MKMRKYKLRTQLSNVSNTLMLLLSIAFAVYTVAFILTLQVNYLSYVLYNGSRLSQVSLWMHNYVSYKFLACIILLILSFACIIIFFLSYYNPIYLHLCSLCILAISYCYSINEANTMLYSGRDAIRIWNILQYISLFTLISVVIFLLYDDATLIRQKFLRYIILAFCFLSCINGVMRWVSMVPSYIGFSILIIISQALLFKKHISRRALQLLPPSIVLLFVQYANYYLRTPKYSVASINSATIMYDLSLFLIPLIVIYIFILCVLRQKDILFYTRDMKFQIHSINTVRSNLRTLLTASVRPSLKAIDESVQQITASTGTASLGLESLKHIKTQLLNINFSLNRLNSYSAFHVKPQSSSLPLVNVKTIVHMLANSLKHNNINFSDENLHIQPDIGYIQVDPAELVHALISVSLVIQELDCSAALNIDGITLDDSFCLIISFQNASSEKNHRIGLSSREQNKIEHSLLECKTVLRRSNGYIELQQHPQIKIKVCLPAIQNVQPDPIQNIRISESASDSILFLSTDQKQREQISMLLPHDGYKISVSNDARYFLQNMNLMQQYSLVIIGNLYYDVDYLECIDRLRLEYSMTQLPALLLLPDGLSENEFHISTKFNNYLAPPYTASSIQKAVHSLVTLKSAADHTLKTTLKFLQSQMNPHFTFNAITSIMQICINEPGVAYELLESLSKYLRAHLTSLSSNRMSSIEEELDLIAAYLKIENARFASRIQYVPHITCDRKFPILPLLIEPLVENSIKHGLTAQHMISIKVSVTQIDKDLSICVKDNGVGMTQELIQEILNSVTPSNSIGLRNVNQRLKHFYGTALSILSERNCGTEIRFSINNHPNTLTPNSSFLTR